MRHLVNTLFFLLICSFSFAQEYECDTLGIEGPFNFYTTLEPPEVCQGTTFCIEFNNENFNSVLGFVYTLTFDPSEILYVSSSFDSNVIPGEIFLNDIDVSKGQLIVNWIDPNMLGLSLPDDLGLFEICFVSLGDPGEDFSIYMNDGLEPQYPDTGIAYQLSTSEVCESKVITIDGKTSFDGQVCCPSLSITQVSQCIETGSSGTISFAACGGTLPYSVALLDDQNNTVETIEVTEDNVLNFFTDLAEGDYSLQVDDGMSVETQVINLTSADPLSYVLDIQEPECWYTTGSITVSEFSGGTPSYSVRASNGIYSFENIQSEFTGLSNGAYSLTITDANGCTAEESVVLNTPELVLDVNIEPVSCYLFDDGFITVVASGGTPFSDNTYTYNGEAEIDFSTGIILGSSNYNDQENTYRIEVTDANGCFVSEDIEVPYLFSPGDDCDDGDPETINDQITGACTCEGEPAPLLRFLGDTETFLPGDITINVDNCTNGYYFPDGLFYNPATGDSYPFPLAQNVHFQGEGVTDFSSTKLPTDIFNEGTTLVAYIITDETNANLIHEFSVTVICSLCPQSTVCTTCESVLSSACMYCDVESLNNFNSCTAPYDGGGTEADQPNPLCNGEGTPNNMSWYGFLAGSNSITITVQTEQCLEGDQGDTGLEVGVYDDCSGTCIIGSSNCGTTDDIVLSLDNLNIGGTYYIYVDGCSGSQCPFTFQISDTQNFSVSSPQEIQFVGLRPGCDISQGKLCSGCDAELQVIHNSSAAYDTSNVLRQDLDLEILFTFNPPLFGTDSLFYNPARDGSLIVPEDTPLGSYSICMWNIESDCGNAWSSVVCTELQVEDCSMVDGDNDEFPFEEDCDDNNADVYPGAVEICDGIDNNCDGFIDEGLTTTFFEDKDRDGFGDPDAPVELCMLEDGYADNNTDCNDRNPLIFPGGQEFCDGLDNNCDGDIDEGLSLNNYYVDLDGDGFGNPDESVEACVAPTGYVLDNTDCDDTSESAFPGAEEVCDQQDNNCDGEIDEGLVIITYYSDNDRDGYGDPATESQGCALPPDVTTEGGDCDDTNPDVNPGVAEIPDNGIDDDCDGVIDGGVSVNELDGPQFVLHPNPTNGQIYISDFSYSSLVVLNKLGRVVKSYKSKRTEINLADLSEGLYLIQFYEGNKLIGMSKVIRR